MKIRIFRIQIIAIQGLKEQKYQKKNLKNVYNYLGLDGAIALPYPLYCYWWLIMNKRGWMLYRSPNPKPRGVRNCNSAVWTIGRSSNSWIRLHPELASIIIWKVLCFDHCCFIILKANANYCNRQVGIYEVACWHMQYNKISFKVIKKLTVYSVHTCVYLIHISYTSIYCIYKA